ncbi:MAG: hypothetical protein JKX81_00875 [Arenicella sp.]|nr:hypothetical protein [Arenicella sp.]
MKDINGQDAEIYIVGETYSNDQAWVDDTRLDVAFSILAAFNKELKF